MRWAGVLPVWVSRHRDNPATAGRSDVVADRAGEVSVLRAGVCFPGDRTAAAAASGDDCQPAGAESSEPSADYHSAADPTLYSG